MEQYNLQLLKEAEKKYPRIDKQIAARRLKGGFCGRCLRILHRVAEGRQGEYFCTCTPELIIVIAS